MAAHLLAAAFAADESDTDSDGKDEQPLQEAMSHTATEGMLAASDVAISHKKKKEVRGCRWR